jgi:hypothetical protein
LHWASGQDASPMRSVGVQRCVARVLHGCCTGEVAKGEMCSWSTTAAISDLQSGGRVDDEIAGTELVYNFVNARKQGLLWTYCETARLVFGSSANQFSGTSPFAPQK